MADPQPNIAQKSPYATRVEAGKGYWWRSCGQGKKQPFCDGSQKGSSFTPVKHTAGKTATVHFCGGKRPAAKPLCDGSHSKL